MKKKKEISGGERILAIILSVFFGGLTVKAFREFGEIAQAEGVIDMPYIYGFGVALAFIVSWFVWKAMSKVV